MTMVWLGRESVMGTLESLAKSAGLKDILQSPPKLVKVTPPIKFCSMIQPSSQSRCRPRTAPERGAPNVFLGGGSFPTTTRKFSTQQTVAHQTDDLTFLKQANLAAADALLKVMPTLKQQDSTVLTIAICLIHFTSREAGTFEER